MSDVDGGVLPPVPTVDAAQGRRAGIAAVAWLLEQRGGDTPRLREEVATMLDVLGLNGRPIRVNYGANGSSAGGFRGVRDGHTPTLDIRRTASQDAPTLEPDTTS